MNLFLLRHFESEKNITNMLSSSENNEPITSKGRQLGIDFATYYKTFCNRNNITLNKIHCTESTRAIETAQIIADTIVVPIECHASFKSTSSGTLMGKPMEEIKNLDSFFYHNYYLYRKGLLNLYYFDKNWKDPEKETKQDFEIRVINEFLKIVSSNEDILIIGHRASIIAIIIYIARNAGIYPYDFYGHIEIELGKISWIQYKDHIWNIKYINENLQDIIDA